MFRIRTLTIIAAVAATTVAFAPAANAYHRGHRHHRARAAAPVLIPAHQRADYVGLAGVPVPGLIDLGLGPVFPFGGWRK